MNRILALIIIGIAFSGSTFSQEKKLEASAKKSPSWVNGMDKNYIITYAYGADVDEAKNNLQIKIREEIVNAVATYVRSSTEINIENTQRGSLVNTVTQFQKESTIQTGDIPFLKGISLSKADDYYWVKTRNKNTGNISVTYHIKYPFSQGDLQRLIREFEEQDQAMTDKMDEIIALSKNPASVEDLKQCIKQLEQLSEYFIDSRKETTKLEITRCKENLDMIGIEVLQNKPGSLKYQLVLGDKPITTAQKPKVKGSLCVEGITTKKDNAINIVEYSYENCFEDEQNDITVEHRIGSHAIKQTVNIQLSETKVEIYVKDPIRLTKIDANKSMVKTFKIKVPLVAKYEGSFAINKFSLNLTNELNLEVEDIFKEFSSKGIHEFTVEVEKEIDMETFNKINGSDIEGTIYYTAIQSGETLRYKMYNEKVITE